ncbi:hypothetical protein HD553DRAFT_302405 [Filobasidium floriforme]|uniref:uncharacterized protein n=1 Tax=Filobasidium floriforme TaxID=5210 RepID=UPI001E8D763B|nr:uncharacterized protein HD553DRAFT_302405 [Filobasidium floriforme]KAH8090427.1 hypothetical protein HD553DRAFT_302405 [Filobasidium floriforme]
MTSRTTSSTKIGILVATMLVSGSANSLLTKYQDMQCVKNCAPGDHHRENFEQPVWQSLNMFIGEMMCLVAFALQPYFARFRGRSTDAYEPLSQEDDRVSSETVRPPAVKTSGEDTDRTILPLAGWAKFWFLLPTICDLTGTTLMNVGLIYTPVSIYQMTRGLLVLWVGIFSVIFLRRKLYAYQWVCLVLVTTGVALVGLAGSLVKKAAAPDDDQGLTLLKRVAVAVANMAGQEDPAKVFIGVLFIAGAQIFTASQFVIEEKILATYAVEPLQAVGLEGLFGVLLIIIAMPILHLLFAAKSDYFDIPLGYRQIINDPKIAGISAAICVSIALFNLSGLSVTRAVSAAARSTIDTCRTLTIWIVSLSLGWEVLIWPYSLLQVAGFALLVYGTFVFNGLVKPLIFAPSAIALPHEASLEHTGGLPAAGAEGRVGYDILPENESGTSGSRTPTGR